MQGIEVHWLEIKDTPPVLAGHAGTDVALPYLDSPPPPRIRGAGPVGLGVRRAGHSPTVLRGLLLWVMISDAPTSAPSDRSPLIVFPCRIFITYAAGQALTGLFFRLAFADLRRSGLLRTDTPPEAVADTLAWVTAMIVTFVVSIPVAWSRMGIPVLGAASADPEGPGPHRAKGLGRRGRLSGWGSKS